MDQQEVLHGVQGCGLVETTFVIILFLEDVLRAAGRWNRQGLRCLVNVGCDGDPSLVSLVERWE